MHEHLRKVERTHGLIDEKVRAWLIGAKLPKTLWFKASLSSVYLLNRQVSKSSKIGKTPYERRFDVKPNISHLRVFGCLAYGHVFKEAGRKKLDARGRESIFVGYATESPGYELYDLVKGVFYTSGSVEFDENVFPSDQMQENLRE